MSKLNLSEAAKEILQGTVTSKRAMQDAPGKLSGSTAYGTKEAGLIGQSPEKMDDKNPEYTKGTPTATPPGATPPVGSEPMKKLTGPAETMGRSDLTGVKQDDATDYETIRDRRPGKLATQTMPKNPGSTFQSYGEETKTDDEVIAENKEKGEKGETASHERKEKMKEKMKEDIDALLEGENLSEEFVSKATTIFEAAVLARAEEVISETTAELTEQFQVAVEEVKTELAEKVNDYLDYMVQEWITENKLAIEQGLRSELVEDFITGLHGLFKEHYINVPEDKVDIVEELSKRVDELEGSLNEEINKNVAFSKELNEHKKLEAVHTACEGLTLTQVEKLKGLAESLEFTTEAEFADKLATLKESYFKSSVKTAESSDLHQEVIVEEEKSVKTNLDPMMEQYVKSISQTLVK